MRYLAAILILSWMVGQASAQDGDGDCANGQCQRPQLGPVASVISVPLQVAALPIQRIEQRQQAAAIQRFEAPSAEPRRARPFKRLAARFRNYVKQHR